MTKGILSDEKALIVGRILARELGVEDFEDTFSLYIQREKLTMTIVFMVEENVLGSVLVRRTDGKILSMKRKDGILTTVTNER